MCRVLGLCRSGYYAWIGRDISQHSRRDEELRSAILEEHLSSRGVYGAPRLHAMLQRRGLKASRKRVARLMREAGIRGVTRRSKHKTTTRDKDSRPAADLVRRSFAAEGPNQLWVADITHVPTRTGTLYLATVLDVWSRKVVGWAMDRQMPAELVSKALEMAVVRRRPSNLIHHSDRGSQYTSLAFTARCKALNVRTSMGAVGDCYDNAMAESFFATLECELLGIVGTFATHDDAREQVFSFLEGFYNNHRLHSRLGMRSPAEFERDAERSTAHAQLPPLHPQLVSLPPGPPSAHTSSVRQSDAGLTATG
jgi:putative transposase